MQKHLDISPSKNIPPLAIGCFILSPLRVAIFTFTPNLWQFLLWFSVASATNRITGDLVNLCFNVQEPAALGSELLSLSIVH